MFWTFIIWSKLQDSKMKNTTPQKGIKEMETSRHLSTVKSECINWVLAINSMVRYMDGEIALGKSRNKLEI
jgi:hypothetical protein